MFGLLMMEKLSGRSFNVLLTYLFPVSLFVRFLAHTFVGTLLISIALYYFCLLFSETKPWTGYQLVLWLDDIDTTAKTGIVTSVLTVVGFLVAFRTASEGWKVQAVAQMKIRLAEELEAFYSEASQLATDLRLVAEGMLHTEALLRNGMTDEASYGIAQAAQQSTEYHAKRLRLQAMAIQCFRFGGSNYTLLSTMPGVIEWLERCTKALNEIAQKSWITLPTGLPDEPTQRVAMFYRLVQRPAYEAFIAVCKDDVRTINACVGGVRGQLLDPVVKPNANTYMVIRKKREYMVRAIDTVIKPKPKGGS
jgi:hypothetical protein